MAYREILLVLGVLSLYNKRLFTDMVLVFKSIHQLNIKCSMRQLGLIMSTSNTRGENLRLTQLRSHNRIMVALFCNRVSTVWNRLPTNVITEKLLLALKANYINF